MDKLKKALKIFGKEYVGVMSDILRKSDKIASRELIESLKTRVYKTGFDTSYTLKVIAAEHLKYVESGRRKGATPPPVAPIKQWIKDKNIGLPDGAEYGVAKNIGKNGIKPLDVVNKAFKEVQNGIEFRRLEDGAADWVDDLISERFKGFSKKGNITFK